MAPASVASPLVPAGTPFYFIVQRLEELGKTGILNARDLRDMLGLTQEVQLDINTAVLDIQVWNRFVIRV